MRRQESSQGQKQGHVQPELTDIKGFLTQRMCTRDKTHHEPLCVMTAATVTCPQRPGHVGVGDTDNQH